MDRGGICPVELILGQRMAIFIWGAVLCITQITLKVLRASRTAPGNAYGTMWFQGSEIKLRLATCKALPPLLSLPQDIAFLLSWERWKEMCSPGHLESSQLCFCDLCFAPQNNGWMEMPLVISFSLLDLIEETEAQ